MAEEHVSKAVLITGCSTGIGRATAQRLAQRGHRVYATARRLDSIEDLRDAGCEMLALDVTDAESMTQAVKAVEEAEGAVGALVNNAGYSQGGAVETLERPWGEVFDPAEIRAALARRPARIVAIVHAETSTGALQPLADLPGIVHDQGGLVIVDTVASLGGMPVAVDANEIDVCYSGSQKCLSCPPGLGPITFGHRAVEKLRARRQPVTSWYLDLSMVERYWGPERTYHHTAPISLNFALYEALRLVAEEGLEARWGRHRANAELLWAGLEELGFSMHVAEPALRAPALTTVRVPDGVDETAVRRRLLADYGIEIAGGLGTLKGRIWRIGLMGHSSRQEHVVTLLGALGRVLAE